MTAADKPDLLESGIYTFADAAKLLRTRTPTIRTWVNGHGAHQEPLIDNELGRVGHSYVISFTNLMELRFVALFAEADIPLRTIRAIMNEARDVLQHPHPFATSTVFGTDGKRILAIIQRQTGERDVLDLKSRNYEIPAFTVLKPGVVFNSKGEASAWYPRPDTAPNVVMHPHYSFGRPILKTSQIPTAAIAASAKVDGPKVTAAIFDVPLKQVREAVDFQERLRRAA